MSCGAIFYFDDLTDAAIRGLWQVLDDADVPSEMLTLNYPPHLTLLVCEGFQRIEEYREVIKPFIQRHEPLLLSFHSLGIFATDEGVIYLAPLVNRQLLEFHAELWEITDPFTENENPRYRPEAWVPHITLGYSIPDERIGAAVEALRKVTLPRTGILQGLRIGEFIPGASGFKELFKARLGSIY